MNAVQVYVHVNMLQMYMLSCVYKFMCLECLYMNTSYHWQACTHLGVYMCEYTHVWISENVFMLSCLGVCVYIWELTSVSHVYSLSRWVWYRTCLSVAMCKYACMYTYICEWMFVFDGHYYVLWMSTMYVCLCLQVNGCAHVRSSAVWVCIDVSVPMCRDECRYLCMSFSDGMCVWERYLALSLCLSFLSLKGW